MLNLPWPIWNSYPLPLSAATLHSTITVVSFSCTFPVLNIILDHHEKIPILPYFVSLYMGLHNDFFGINSVQNNVSGILVTLLN